MSVDDLNKEHSLKGISIFIGSFGLILFGALFFTDGFRGKITNFICGFLFIIISLMMFYFSGAKNKKVS